MEEVLIVILKSSAGMCLVWRVQKEECLRNAHFPTDQSGKRDCFKAPIESKSKENKAAIKIVTIM